MDDDAEIRILEAWHENARAWTTAVREHAIESRRLVSDRAVVAAVLEHAPRRVLDIGCGEGWLARALAAHGIEVLGVDAVPELVAQAAAAGGGEFRVLGYDAIAAGALAGEGFDLAVANFSLLGETSVAGLLAALPQALVPDAALVVQTLHPAFACGDRRYEDGWRAGAWPAGADEFETPPPWYFRTLGSWLALLATSGFRPVSVREPLHPDTGQPVSLLMVARRRG